MVESFTFTTKFPRPGFSGLTTTFALAPTAFTILLARVLKADHCLQASMVTDIIVDETSRVEALAAAAFPATSSVFFFVLAVVFFLAGGFFSSLAASLCEDRTMVQEVRSAAKCGRNSAGKRRFLP